MTNDIIADLLTRIRNANSMKYKTVEVNSSKLVLNIVEILVKEGYIAGYTKKEEGASKLLVLDLKYNGTKKERVISGLKRISKPSLRVYANANEMPRVLNGLGIAIVSTSKGIMTDKDARKENLGGEVLAYIW